MIYKKHWKSELPIVGNESHTVSWPVLYDRLFTTNWFITPIYLLSSEIRIPPQYMVFRNLPEVSSAHEILGVPTVSARFGTSPFFWNWGMEAMTTLLPSVCSWLTWTDIVVDKSNW